MYLWMKWVHIIAVISWMAGILYLYRLFINHRDRGIHSSDNHELLKGMEFRLYRYITLPAMIVAVAAGIAMIFLLPELLSAKWLQLKLALVVLLMAATLCAGHLRQVAADDPGALPTGKALRWANEFPTILMLIIVGLVVFKPW